MDRGLIERLAVNASKRRIHDFLRVSSINLGNEQYIYYFILRLCSSQWFALLRHFETHSRRTLMFFLHRIHSFFSRTLIN